MPPDHDPDADRDREPGGDSAPEPFGVRADDRFRTGDRGRGDPEPGAGETDGWGSEVAIALGLVGGVLLLAGLLFVGLGGFGTDGGTDAGVNDADGADAPAEPSNASVGDETNESPADADENESDGDDGDPQEPADEPGDGEPADGDQGDPDAPADGDDGDQDDDGDGDAPTDPDPEPPADNDTDPADNETPTDPNPEPPADPEPPANETDPGNETNTTEPPTGTDEFLVIRVVDEQGEPIEGEPVTVTYEDESSFEHETDVNGEVVIAPDITDGSADVVPITVAVRGESETVLIHDGEQREIEFTVESGDGGNETNITDPIAGNETNETPLTSV